MDQAFSIPQPFLTILFRAIFATAYYGLFRVGELTLSQHVAKAKDVHVGDNKNKLMIVLHSSKTHSEGDKPQIIKIRSTDNCHQKNDAIFCPFKLIQIYPSAIKICER